VIGEPEGSHDYITPSLPEADLNRFSD